MTQTFTLELSYGCYETSTRSAFRLFPGLGFNGLFGGSRSTNPPFDIGTWARMLLELRCVLYQGSEEGSDVHG